MTQKVYELTTNEKDGYAKWYVRGIKDDSEARKIALKGFGKNLYSNLISHYGDYPSKYGTDWSKAHTIQSFIKKMKKVYGKNYRTDLKRDRKIKAKYIRKSFQPTWRGDLKGSRI